MTGQSPISAIDNDRFTEGKWQQAEIQSKSPKDHNIILKHFKNINI